MGFSLLEIITLVLSGLLFIVTIGVRLWWKLRRRPFTRERFAFFGVSSIVLTTTILLPILLGTNTWLLIANEITKKFFDFSIEFEKPDLSDKLVVCFLVGLLSFVILRIFDNWKGLISLRQYNLEKESETTHILKDFVAFVNRDPELKLFNPIEDENVEFKLPKAITETLAWHEQAADLLSLYDNQFSIKVDQDWYRAETCFISKYGREDRPVGIYCSLNEPNTHKISRFIAFVQNNIPVEHSDKQVRFMILVKKDKFESNVLNVNNFDVELMCEGELLDNLIDFTSYFDYLKVQFEEKEVIDGYGLKLKDIYAEPFCTRNVRGVGGGSEYKIENIEDYICDWAKEIKQNKHLAILGEYGQGKSVLSQRIAYLIATRQVNVNRIPIIVELRGRYPKQYQNPLALISDWCSNFSINPKALLKLHYAGRLLIFFEGFDEMELIGDYEIRIDHFRRLWEFSTPNSKLIITGRPNFFLNDNELKTLLRTEDELTDLPYCEEIYIDKFDVYQIKNALRSADESTRNDILGVLSAQSTESSFFDLLSRPSSLFLTSVVWKERELSKYKSNINSAVVIEEFLKHSYSRQAKKDVKTPLSIYERAYFMQGIAVGMVAKHDYTNQITQNELKELVLKLFKNFPEEITKSQVLDSAYQKPLKKRFDKRYNEESVLLDIRSCGILVRDLSTFDSFKFAHKSFLELLISQYILLFILNNKDNDLVERIIKNSISNTLGISSTTIIKSPDVVRFIAQLASKKIEFPLTLGPNQKIKFLFKKVYAIKALDMHIVFKLIPYFGHDIRMGFMTNFLQFCITFAFIYFIIGGSNLFLVNLSEYHYLQKIVSITIIILISMLAVGIINRLMRRSLLVMRKHYDFDDDQNNSSSTFLVRSFSDHSNLTLWYMLCKELGLEDALQGCVPKKLILELEYNEAFLSRDYDRMEFLLEEMGYVFGKKKSDIF